MSDFDKLIAATLKSQVLRAAAKRKFYTNYIFEWIHGTVPVDIRFLFAQRNLEGH